MTCNKCGSPVQDGDSFCQSCGNKLNAEQNSFNQQTNQNGFNQNQQNNQNSYNQSSFNQNQQYNNSYNQNQQYNNNYNNKNQQYNNGYNQNGYNQGGFYPRAPITERNIVMCILLSIITCGIYNIIWFIGMVDDLNLVSEEPNPTSGGMVFLLGLVTCGIYTLYWMYKAGDLMNQAKYKRGMMTDNNSGILYLGLTLFGLVMVSYCLIQNDLNKMATM